MLLYLGLVIIVAIWLFWFRLTLKSDQIVYRSLLGGKQTMQRDQLKHYKFEWYEKKYEDRFKPRHRVILSPKKRGGKKIVINYEIFDQTAFKEFLKAIDADIEKNNPKKAKS